MGYIIDMSADNLIIHSQVIPPRRQRGILNRPRLGQKMEAVCDVTLTIVQAGTGYGKSTVLSSLQDGDDLLAWYTITLPHRDPAIFLAHLLQAFITAGLAEVPPYQARLGGETGLITPALLTPLLNAIAQRSDEDILLVLDDYHHVIGVPEIDALIERLIEYAPPNLHIVLSTRRKPKLEAITHREVKGDTLLLTREDLAFTCPEVDELFQDRYRFPLSETQCIELMTLTEGWAIALQLIWQTLQRSRTKDLDEVLEHLPSTLEALFEYLAQEILAKQADDVQTFLLQSSILHDLNPESCAHLTKRTDSAELLSDLSQAGLFLIRHGDTYRFHNLFRDFLRNQAAQRWPSMQPLQRQAATYFEANGNREESIYHWLLAEEYSKASQLMVELSVLLVRDGRLDTLSEWVTALPPAVLDQNPILMYRMGELCRFASRFDEALAWYTRAQERYHLQHDLGGVSRALRGQAAVHLDTVHPNKAEALLQEGLRLIDGQQDREEQARLLDLMGENMTNRGRSEQAEALHEQARRLRSEGPGRADLDVRVLLRTGRLVEAEVILNQRINTSIQDGQTFREPRSHRETLLVLSLIQAIKGSAYDAYTNALRGINIGRRLGSPFVEAVGNMRLGHALQILPHHLGSEETLACYHKAMGIAEELAVPRTKVEAFWGLTRLHGFQGDIAAAERYATDGIDLALRVGDEWIAAHVETTLGASLLQAGQPQRAARRLRHAVQSFQECGDPFGVALARTWQCLLPEKVAEQDRRVFIEDLLTLSERHSYAFLLRNHTFLGPPDSSLLLATVLKTIPAHERSAYLKTLLDDMGLPSDVEYHPPHSLHIATLGRFVVRRGEDVVSGGEWHREKSKSLFRLFLAERNRFLDREEILSTLWPETDPEAAENRFKVALNALNQVLEPDRPARAPTRFIQRRGNAYGLHPDAPIWYDAVVMEETLKRAQQIPEREMSLDLHRRALDLYEGDFLPDCLYLDWCRTERERLRVVYKQALVRSAEMLIQIDDQLQALRYTQRALAVDNCMEAAYRMLMRIYSKLGNRVEAMRTYDRCAACLREELDVAPMTETTSLYEEIRSSNS